VVEDQLKIVCYVRQPGSGPQREILQMRYREWLFALTVPHREMDIADSVNN